MLLAGRLGGREDLDSSSSRGVWRGEEAELVAAADAAMLKSKLRLEFLLFVMF